MDGITFASAGLYYKDHLRLKEDDLGFYLSSSLPKGLKPIALDNVAGTGLTGKAAINALGQGFVLTLAMDDNFYEMSKGKGNIISTMKSNTEERHDKQTHKFNHSF